MSGRATWPAPCLKSGAFQIPLSGAEMRFRSAERRADDTFNTAIASLAGAAAAPLPLVVCSGGQMLVSSQQTYCVAAFNNLGLPGNHRRPIAAVWDRTGWLFASPENTPARAAAAFEGS